jgi:nucleoid-associated protein YgaU
MDIYLTKDGKDFRFPVNPEEIKIKTGKKINTIDVLNIGEVDFPVGDLRTEIQFSSFFPVNYDSYCQYADFPQPLDALKILNDIRYSGQPVKLLITETPINNMVLLPEVQYTPSKGGEPGDIYFDVTFRVWRELAVKTVSSSSINLSGLKTRPYSKTKAKIYIVRPDDCLWNIAKKELHDASRWREIYNLNRKVIGPDPNKIKPGQKYVMPA